VTHQPMRGDDVANWLKAERDKWFVGSQLRLTATQARSRTIYTVIDDLLDSYRLHADTGTPLDQEVIEPGDEGYR
jgi:hypothetical protein